MELQNKVYFNIQYQINYWLNHLGIDFLSFNNNFIQWLYKYNHKIAILGLFILKTQTFSVF